jgi:dihydrofolate reductase
MEKSMTVNAILAMDDNMGIGYENDLPWPRNKKDMAWFRECTSGHVVVMGRKTWESFGSKPLPNRTNIVISTKKPEGNPDVWYGGDIKMILDELRDDYSGLHIFIIGGANIYRQALPFCDKLYITRIKGVYKCDTFMYNNDFKGFEVQDYIDADENMTIQIRSKT